MSEPPGDRQIPPVIFSPDGEPPPSDRMPDRKDVTKIVIGQLPEDDEAAGKPALTVDEIGFDIDLEGDLATQFPKLTHLHLWRIGGLKTLGKLPPELKCLDVRYCPDLETVEELPGKKLHTLVLESNSALREVPAGSVSFGKLSDLSFRGSPRIDEEILNTILGDAPNLKKFDASECGGLSFIEGWPETLVDLRLDDCESLSALPPQWPVKLRRLQLRKTDLDALPDFPGSLDYIDLGGMRRLHQLPDDWANPRTLFLFGSGLLMPPASEHGETVDENVANGTRAFFKDFELAGEGTVKRCKLLMLGNGSAGKTCLSLNLTGGDPRRTCPDYEPVEDRLGTTHGVEFHDWELKAKVGPKTETVHVHLWDFGGQEIYHNTHRLFMSKGTVFIVVWNPEQFGRQPEPDASGHQDRWRPLSYWLDYIDLACPQDPLVAIVCAGHPKSTDQLEDQLRKEIGRDRAAKLDHFFIDSLEQTGDLSRLKRWLRDEVGKTVAIQGTAVPAHWEIAQDLVESWVSRFKDEPDFAATHQQLDSGAFGKALDAEIGRRLAEEPGRFSKLTGAIEAGEFSMTDERVRRTLAFLTHSGWIYWDPKLFDGRAIIGQKWALDGIYTVLERVDGEDQSPIYLQLKNKGGRFTLEDLDRWGWDREIPDEGERELLISFMERIGLCFPLVNRHDSLRGEPVYLSLAHLQDRPEKWRTALESAELPGEGRSVSNPRLHAGQWQAILTDLGRRFGTDGEYAGDGFFAVNEDGQSILIRADLNTDELGGRISVDVAGPDAVEMEKNLAGTLSEQIRGAIERVRVDGSVGETAGQPDKAISVFLSYACQPSPDDPRLRVIPDGYERPVDMLFEALEDRRPKIVPLRDKDAIESGQSIMDFIELARTTDRVIVIHSDKYWKSAFCMYEFTELIKSLLKRRDTIDSVLVLLQHYQHNFDREGHPPSAGPIKDGYAKRICHDYWKEEFSSDDLPPMLEKITNAEHLRAAAVHLLLNQIPEISEILNFEITWDDNRESEIVEEVIERLSGGGEPADVPEPRTD